MTKNFEHTRDRVVVMRSFITRGSYFYMSCNVMLVLIITCYLSHYVAADQPQQSSYENLIKRHQSNPEIPNELLPDPSVGSQSGLSPMSLRIHTVKSGETLWDISRLYGIKLNVLLDSNQLRRSKVIRPGQKLVITKQSGIFRKVRRGETIGKICRTYRVELSDLLAHNQILDPHRIAEGTMLFLPGVRAIKPTSQVIWPLRGRLSSTYGTRRHPMGGGRKFHYGIDIAAPVGRRIVAAQDGKVTFARRKGSLGRCVMIQHRDGYKTVYGHMHKILVKKRDQIRQGESIGLVGRSGKVTGPHLHFEIHRNGRPIDPLLVLPSK
jgi:murein DD-endopeptidase MepM/ murein hydrolase activator NlpD